MTNNKTDLTAEQLQKAQETMKYIRESVMIKNESGKYEISNANLSNYSFEEDEKKIITNFVSFMNESQGVQLRANTFTRCVQDAFSIGKSLATEVGNQIEKGNWLAAGGLLVTAGKLANPVTAFAFFMLCGATPAG